MPRRRRLLARTAYKRTVGASDRAAGAFSGANPTFVAPVDGFRTVAHLLCAGNNRDAGVRKRGDEVAECIAIQDRIGVGERSDLSVGMREGGANCGQLSLLERQFDDLEAPIAGRARDISRVVGAAIAGNDAIDAVGRVVQVQDVADFRADQRRLVVGGDHERDGWPNTLGR